MRLYLLRHTSVGINSGICYGQTDVPLSNNYIKELDAVKLRLQGVEFEKVYSSPLSRCRILATHLSDSVILDERLREFDFGDWEGTSWDDIFASAEGKKWFSNYIEYQCPNGESSIMLEQRIKKFIDELPRVEGNILLVTHFGVIRLAMKLLKGWSYQEAFDYKFGFGEHCFVDID